MSAEVVMRYVLQAAAMLLLAVATTAFGQCGSGNIQDRQVDCCGTIQFVSACQGIFGECNSLAHMFSCTTTCGVFSAGECLSAKSIRSIHKSSLAVDVARLRSQKPQPEFLACGSSGPEVFTEWLTHTAGKF